MRRHNKNESSHVGLDPKNFALPPWTVYRNRTTFIYTEYFGWSMFMSASDLWSFTLSLAANGIFILVSV